MVSVFILSRMKGANLVRLSIWHRKIYSNVKLNLTPSYDIVQKGDLWSHDHISYGHSDLFRLFEKANFLVNHNDKASVTFDVCNTFNVLKFGGDRCDFLMITLFIKFEYLKHQVCLIVQVW